MAAQPEVKNKISALYQRGHLETAVFSWISSAKYIFPDASVDSAISGFYKFYGISPEDYSIDTARSTYYRMQKELLELQKSKK